ncbi:MAG: sigma 54-interacting transcriptional regulator [Syntrophaceae bacterium]
MESQVREIDNRESIEEALEEQLRFERLLSDVSARFVNIAPNRLDEEIEHALWSVMKFFQVDRCGLIRTLPGKSSWLITHVACSQDVPPVPTGIELPRSINPWAYDRLIEKREPICFAKPEDTPAEAEVDRATWKEWGIRSNLVIPVVTGDAVDHLIAINSVKRERALPPELIPRLRLLGEIFVNALERRRAEQALRESENRLELAAASAEARLWELDTDRGVIWVTEKGREFYKLAPDEELTFARFLDRVHPEDRGLIRESIEKGEAGEEINIEYRVEATPGDLRWISSRGRLFVEPTGKKRSIMGVSIDVTDRKRTELQLCESQTLLSSMIDSTSDMIWSVDSERFGLLTFNRGLSDYFMQQRGISIEAGMRPEDLFPAGPFVKTWHDFYKKALAQGSYTVEYLVYAGTRTLLLTLSRVERDGVVFGVSVFGRDITERKAMEAMLRESEERLSLATASAETGIWVMDVGTGSVWATDKLRDLFRFAPDEKLSMERFLEAIHPEDRGRVQELVRRSIEQRELLVVEYRILHPDGSVRWIVSRGRLGAPGRPDRLMGVSNDVTGRKEMEAKLREQLEEIERLRQQLEKENIVLREELGEEKGFGEIIGSSDALNYVLFRVGQVAPTDATVLILGETGTGKGMVANAIHGLSSRKDRPMITVNCAALPANLIESELFGREKGAFTGAHARQAGRFEAADGGTIFLDEIGELPLELQSKLLRVLQDGEFERLGSAKTVKADVRVIASTSRDLREEVRAGRFREDLFYRLNVFPVTLPPLRKRADDIPQLVRFFVDKYSRRIGRRIENIPKAAMKALGAYHWPGNVRELEHVIERAVITTEGPSLQLADQFEPLRDIGDAEESLKDLAAMEREHILRVLKETGWRIEGPKGAAAILQLHPSTLRFRIKKLGIRRP